MMTRREIAELLKTKQYYAYYRALTEYMDDLGVYDEGDERDEWYDDEEDDAWDE